MMRRFFHDKPCKMEMDMIPTHRKLTAVLAIGLVMGIFWGCANSREKQPSAIEQWKKLVEQSKGYSPTARDRSLEAMPKKIETMGPDVPAATSGRTLPSRKITMKMHMTDVPVLLRALARSVDLNIMINESVKGKISINVKDARWDQVFTGILNSQGLAYEWEGNIVRIVTIEDRDRNLKNLEAQEKILAKQRELETRAPMVTKIIPIDFASAEKLKDNVQKVLDAKKQDEFTGSVLVDTHTNSLIVQATPTDIERIIPMIMELDRPTPQVLIEAHIVETTTSTARELGVQWGGVYNKRAFGVSPNAISDISGVASGASVDPKAGTAINFPSGFQANTDNAAQTAGMVLGFLTQGTDGILALQLSALEEEGKLNILSSPSITTLDNAKAVIESGDEVPIPVFLSDTSNVIYKEALLSLEVTPHVIQNDALKLEIITTKNEVDFSRTVQTYPTIVAKKAETNVILFDGETTVIGGLKKNTNQDTEAGVPWLRKIPVLGYFFKSEGRSEEMQELLIFITPHILGAKPAAAAQPAAPAAGTP